MSFRGLMCSSVSAIKKWSAGNGRGWSSRKGTELARHKQSCLARWGRKASGMRNVAFAVLICLTLTGGGDAQEWTRFRGHNGSGVSASRFPVVWTDDVFLWKIELPGKGHSSPVVWG